MTYDLFLAHAGADSAPAEQLYDLLRPGIDVFLDSRSLSPGDEWDRAIAAAQHGSRATVLLVSRRFDLAYYLREELATAIALRRANPDAHRVIPVFLDGFPANPMEVPYGVRIINSLDAVREGGLAGVAKRLGDEVAKWRALSPAAGTAASPAVTAAPVLDAVDLHERLCKLLDSQFETLIFYAGLRRADIAGQNAPLTTRALDVVGMVQQGGPETERKVCEALAKIAPALRCPGAV